MGGLPLLTMFAEDGMKNHQLTALLAWMDRSLGPYSQFIFFETYEHPKKLVLHYTTLYKACKG
jgi:hypothetical protein